MNRHRSLSSQRRAYLLAALSLLLASSGCTQADPKPEAAAPAASPVLEDTLVVFAASSLRDAFTAMAEDFKHAHPGLQITFNFAGTQELRTQVEQGATPDVFASADQRHMGELVKAGHVLAPEVIARNEPVIVVAKEAAEKIHGLADLPNAERLVIGTAEVPIGRYTLQILDHAGPSLGADFRSRVEAKVASRELNVRQVLTKVKLGEAEAGIVYRTDALSAPEVTVVSIPSELNVIAEYPLAIVFRAPHPQVARAWIAFVHSEAGQSALQRAGFLAPAAAQK